VKILSIQSHVAYGHAGNSAAVFPLQRLGHEVYPVLTVTFSNHTGYGSTRGPLIAPADVAAVIDGVEERGAFPAIDAVLSGYQGAEAVGEVVLDAVARVKAANPAAIYCCDPVMGDVGRGFFVREGIPEYMRDHVVPRADIVTPNQFELDHLTGRVSATRRDALAAIDALHALGPKAIMVTSLHTDETPGDAIDLVASDAAGRCRVRTPKLPISVNGAGDAIAALFFAHYLRSSSAAESLSRAASSIFGVLKRTAEAGAREIMLIDAQDEFVTPSRVFPAEPI
jgi:pyridoxine kinase